MSLDFDGEVPLLHWAGCLAVFGLFVCWGINQAKWNRSSRPLYQLQVIIRIIFEQILRAISGISCLFKV